MLYWVPSIAASGIAFYSGDRIPAWEGNLFVGAMTVARVPQTGRLERIVFADNGGEIRRESLLGEFRQRIRDVREGPDGLLYILMEHGQTKSTFLLQAWTKEGNYVRTVMPYPANLPDERLAGLPADDWRQDPEMAPHFAEPRLTRNLALVDLIADIATETASTVPDVAIAWTLHNEAVTGAIVGLRSAAQVDGVLGAADLVLNDDQRARIRAWLEANP